MNVSNNGTGRTKHARAGGSGIPLTVAAHIEDAKNAKVIDVVGLRQLIGALNPSETQRKAIETDLKGIDQRVQDLVAVSPAIIYTTKASGDYACTFVSENLRAGD
jgi:hypothetical protein